MKYFRSPPAELRARPFWALNGSLGEEELKRQIAVMREMGFGGAYLHSRTGLSTEYLSEEWFRLMNVCADELEKNGMSAYLYDEDRYPSGVAGGYVPMHKEFRGKYLTVRILSSAEYRAEEGDIRVFSVKFKGERLISYRPYAGGKGQVAVFSVREREAQDVYNGYPYFDALKKEATEEFLHVTLDRYAEEMGERMGRSVKGVFTDEPNRGAVFNGFAHLGADAERRTPYTEELFPAYFEKWHERLEDKLPELYFRGKNTFSRTAWRYLETLTTLFLRNYAEPYHEWCRKHNIAFTGHILHEDNLSAMTALCGSPMRFYELMDAPGVDNLTADSTNIAVPVMCSSVARQCGKKNVLSEMYAVIGWQADFRTYKRIGDWHAFFGVNDRCTHLSMYTMGGIAKRDYPASILSQSVWWKDYRMVEDYFARLNVFLSQGKQKAELLWIHPVESAWGMSRMEGYNNFFVPKDPGYLALETRYRNVSDILAESGIKFDFGDEEMMSRLACTERKNGKVYLRVGRERYERVLLAGSVTLRNSTVKLLRRFLRMGGEVLLVGDFPVYREGNRFCAEKALAGVKRIEEKDLPAAVSLPFRAEGGKVYTHFAAAVRKRYFAAVSAESEKREFVFSFAGKFSFLRYDPRTGRHFPVSAKFGGGMSEIHLSLDAGEEVLLVLSENGEPMSVSEHKTSDTVWTNLPETNISFTLKEPNVCVLDRARYTCGGEDGEDEILRIDAAVRSRLGLPLRTPEGIQPWFKRKFMLEKPCGERVTLRFPFGIRDIPPSLNLVFEPIEGAALFLNGVYLGRKPARSAWDNCFVWLPLPVSALKHGENVIEVSFPMEEETPIEAMYLTGRFGVEAEGHSVTLCRLPETLSIGDIVPQGLPFYCGELVYRFPLKAGKYRVRVPSFGGALVRIGNKARGFAPFEADVTSARTLQISVMVTQRNKFGPLHYRGESRGAFGEFCPSEEDFSEDFRLIGQGLFMPPSVKEKRDEDI